MKYTVLPKVGLLLILFLFSQKANAQLTSYLTSVQTGTTLETVPTTNGLITTTIDNGSSSVVLLPFNFNFAGTSYSQFSVNSNGLMKFGATAVTTVSANALASTTDNPKLAVYWDDLGVNTAGGIYYTTIGTTPNRKFVVQFKLLVPKTGSTNYTAQVWLFESSNIIQFVYDAFPVNSGQYTVGLATSSTSFISVSPNGNNATFSTSTANNANTAAITSGLSVTFAPVLCANITSPVNGASGINGLAGTTLSWTNGGGATSYDVYFGTTTNPPLVSTSQLGTTYATGVLADSTTYYWRVAPKNAIGTLLNCAVNQFTTSSLINYTVNRSTAISFNSIAATGNTVSSWKNGSNTDDNISNNIPIGFNFRYVGGLYSSLQIGLNGFLVLDTTNNFTGGGGTNPYNYEVNNFFATGTTMSPLMIAPFYQDLICQGNPGTSAALQNSIRYSTSGTSPNRVFTVEWIYMQTFNNQGPNLNFQVKLYESNNSVEFVYGTMEEFNGSQNVQYKYNVGFTGRTVSSPARTYEIFGQLSENTNSFGIVNTSLQKSIPSCFTSLLFTPGKYTPVTVTSVVPLNDNPAGAISLPFNSSICTSLCGTYFSSQNATASGQSACFNADDDVWFSFTPTSAATTIRLEASGGFTPGLELWNSGVTTRLNCTGASTGLTARISTTLSAGTLYYVRVYDTNIGSGVSGRFSICVSATQPPPSNDDCSGAISLAVNPTITYTTGTVNLTATSSASIPACSVTGTNADDDVWYSFIAVNPTEVISVKGGNGFDAVVQLFSGTCGALTSMQCVNAIGSGQVETITATNLTVNQRYFFRVYHSTVGAGTGNYSVSVSSPVPDCVTTLLPATATTNVPVTGITLRWNRVPNVNFYRVLIDSLNNPPVNVFATTTDTFYVKPSVEPGYDYFWSAQGVNASGASSGCISNYFSAVPLYFALNVRVFLEGFYQGNNIMSRSLNPADTLADTITVNLMNPTTRQLMYSAKSVLGVSGYSSPTYPQPAVGQIYYIQVKHRNHLETWSSTTFNWLVPDTLYDFTNGVSKAFGNNMVQVAPGAFAIYGGDINQDGSINATDFNLVSANMLQFSTGYIREDVTGDRILESTDFSFMENKYNSTIQVIRP